MWPASVVVPQVLSQHLSQVVLIDDQQSVEEFTTQGADPDAFCGEDGVERAGELARAVPDQELDCGRALALWGSRTRSSALTWSFRRLARIR
jgi:hypothetical protein